MQPGVQKTQTLSRGRLDFPMKPVYPEHCYSYCLQEKKKVDIIFEPLCFFEMAFILCCFIVLHTELPI